MHLLLTLLAIGAATHATAQDTIASVATSAGLSTLVAAVSACPPILSAATNASTAVTVFAPTNEVQAAAAPTKTCRGCQLPAQHIPLGPIPHSSRAYLTRCPSCYATGLCHCPGFSEHER